MPPAQQAANSRSGRRAFCVVACCAVLATTAPAGSFALFSGARGHGPSVLQGAHFSPAVAPVVSHVRVRSQVTLTWSAVTISSGATVLYRVMRIPVAGSPVEVCTGASAPVTTAGTVSCTQAIPGANNNDTYTEQPYIAYLGQVTWSLPASTPA